MKVENDHRSKFSNLHFHLQPQFNELFHILYINSVIAASGWNKQNIYLSIIKMLLHDPVT